MNGVRCFPIFSEAKKVSETHRGAGAWYVTVIVCETKSDGFPWTIARKASPTDEHL